MQHTVMSDAAWTKARVELLKEAKELTRLRDEISRQRRTSLQKDRTERYVPAVQTEGCCHSAEKATS